ncbi:MAG: glycosylhydrolase-like jelly roll fold domain-containing protein, partial [bacterium]
MRGIHRADGGTHVFFVAHAGGGGNATCKFTVEGMQPELWDPVTGTMRELSDFRFENGKTVVPLKFAPAQSWFVVFRKKAAQPQEPRPNFPELQNVAELTGPWDVRFDPKWGGPAEVRFDKLEDWTKRPEPGIRYYSGTATYRKSFDGANGTWLDLGTVNHIARVRLNGRNLGVVWTAPWGVEIPQGLLKPTGNELEIEGTNVWANRLIGDEQEPPDCEW